MPECNICLEDEEKGEKKWEKPCTNRHVYCRECITRWMNECKTKRQVFVCPVCKEELDDSLYLFVPVQEQQQRCNFVLGFFFGGLIPIGILLLIVYIVETVKNDVSCFIASLFLIFVFIAYIRLFTFTVISIGAASIHPTQTTTAVQVF